MQKKRKEEEEDMVNKERNRIMEKQIMDELMH